MSEPSSAIASLLGRVPSGLFVLTARNADGEETGLLASWVQQAGFDPPVLTVAVNKKRFVHDWLAAVPHLALSGIGETQKNLVGHFGRGFEPGSPAFTGLQVEHTGKGAPVLVEAIGWMAGDVLDSMDVGDHIVYAIRITEASVGPRLESEKPWVHLRKNGLNY
ncbi:MAG: flavin reductase [Planctomycetaceae bacterium]|nr:flavin reductase [Planctomycetaceae bacterium]